MPRLDCSFRVATTLPLPHADMAWARSRRLDRRAFLWRAVRLLEASIRPYAEGSEAQPVGYIEGWYVDPDVRRHGVGRALVVAAEDWVRSLGCRQMASDVEIENGVSVEAHVAIGYREVGRVVHFSKDLGGWSVSWDFLSPSRSMLKIRQFDHH